MTVTWDPAIPRLQAHITQVEQLYNGLLDRADQLREEMGEITDNVSLRTALETIWNDMAGDLRALRVCSLVITCSSATYVHTVSFNFERSP